MHATLLDVLVKMLVALGIVLGGMRLLAMYAKRRGIPGLAGMTSARSAGRAARQGMHVLARQPLGKGMAVVAVQVGVTVMLLGVTPTSINPLGEVDPLAFETFPDDVSSLQELTESVEEEAWEPSRTVRGALPARNAAPSDTSTWMSKLDQLRDLTTRRS